MRGNVGADPPRAQKLSDARAPFGGIETRRREIAAAVNHTRRTALDDASDTKTQLLLRAIVLRNREAERRRARSIRRAMHT